MKKFRIPATIVACVAFALFFLADRGNPVSAAGGPPCQEMQKGGTKPCCECDCDGHGMPPMMEGMKKHMEEARKSVDSLRAHEKKLEGIADPAEFRKAAIEHFRMLDDLQESHVKHMESMTGGGKHGHRHHGDGPHGPCKDCPNR